MIAIVHNHRQCISPELDGRSSSLLFFLIGRLHLLLLSQQELLGASSYAFSQPR
jgi:hypothetical protein